MPDEINERAVVDNEAMTNDYFQEYQEVDDEGNPTASDHTDTNEGSQPPENTQPTSGNDQQPDKSGNEGQQNQMPQGFASRFFKQDDEGEQVFDADAAHGFLFDENGPRFAYQARAAQQQPPAQQPQQNQEQPNEEVPEWKRPIVERQKREEHLMNQMLHPIQRARDTLGQNADPQTQQFLSWQEQQAREYVRNELLPQWEYERQQEQAKRQAEERQETERMAEYREKARINQAALAAKMGGEESFNQFFIGQQVQGPDGKTQFQKGPASDAVNHLFEMQNPDKASLQGEELRTAMNQWWTKFSANQQNLHLLYELGLANLQRQLWPRLVDKIGAAKEKEIRGQQRAQTPPPSGSNAIPNEGRKPGTGFQELDQYLETL